MSETDILLIDAYSQIFRCFYAIGALSNSKGQMTNAIFGFTRLMLKINADYPTPYGAFILDCGKPAFRLEIAPDYKANRPPMPPELRQQIPTIETLAEAFGWPKLVREGYEADDLLAAIAAEFADRTVKFISSDKDLAQIIDDRVKMLVPAAKGGGFTLRGTAEVREKFEVAPEQMIDYLALIGDTSDNIPGVPGVGPKTAAKLIAEHGSLANIFTRPELIGNPKLRQKIADNLELLKKNVKLISLNTEVRDKPWKNLDSLARKTPDWEQIRSICEEMELKSILRELPDSNAAPPEVKPEKFAPDLFGEQ
ncbi:MAG: 5'-3' exonuclease H3TH domain-containing protein [Victivallaceae bacterium]|nr:5'-3' exonuclease H3TH domain-containing protein [Victivallaceae bacterium]